jgi:hypothetical protein
MGPNGREVALKGRWSQAVNGKRLNQVNDANKKLLVCRIAGKSATPCAADAVFVVTENFLAEPKNDARASR